MGLGVIVGAIKIALYGHCKGYEKGYCTGTTFRIWGLGLWVPGFRWAWGYWGLGL